MTDIKLLHIPGYEKVIEAKDPISKLHCFIAIHNTTLGPAMGGTRIYPYKNREEALTDALRLAKAMTYKSSLAEVGLGGGKGVIIADPKKEKTTALLHAYAEVVHTLKGTYIPAEDVGSTPEDMAIIREKTPFVAALPSEKSSGDPSRFTAWGVLKGIQAVAWTLWKTHSLKGKTIAVQGLGNVGSKLAAFLFWEGADLIVSDIDPDKAQKAALLYGAKVVSPQDIFSIPCDIFSPCSLGGVLNSETIPFLQCKAIAGAANNQLLDPSHGHLLQNRHILYAPDFVLNAGGIINASHEFDREGYNPKVALKQVNHIYDTLLQIFDTSHSNHNPPSEVADKLAEYKLTHRIGKRAAPLNLG